MATEFQNMVGRKSSKVVRWQSAGAVKVYQYLAVAGDALPNLRKYTNMLIC